MDFPPPYFAGDELSDDHPYDYYPMNMPFDPNRYENCISLINWITLFFFRYRNHFGGRYDPSGFH